MRDVLEFVLLGIGAGGAYGLLSLGVVLIHKGSGVINFAQGAFALVGAGVFVSERKSAGSALAVVLAVLAGALVSVVVQAAIMRPMRSSSPMSRIVATLAVLLAIENLAERKYGSTVTLVPAFLPSSSVHLMFGLSVGADRLCILAIAAAACGVLWVVYRSTRFGLATTAIAENERSTAALGWSPNLLSACNWAAGGALAGLSGALLVPITGLSAQSLALAIVPALAAALVGGFDSFPLTMLGGVLIGVCESEATYFTSRHATVFSHVSTNGLSSAVPLAAIIVLLVVRGRTLPIRGHRADRLPRVGTGRVSWVGALGAFAISVASLWVFSTAWVTAITTGAVLGLLYLSSVVVTGYCGQISLAQFTLAGVGAFMSSRTAQVWGAPFLVALLIGVVFTLPVGLLLALPAIRTRGVNLAVITLGFSVVVTNMLLSTPAYTGGLLRGTVVRPPTLFGLPISAVGHPQRYAIFCLSILLMCFLLVTRLRLSIAGRRLMAVRDNERSASGLGIEVPLAKLYAFGLGAVLASLSGTLIAFRDPNVDFSQFSVLASITYLLQSFIGGIGMALGALIAGITSNASVVLEVLSHWFHIQSDFVLISSFLVLFVLVLHPHGIADGLVSLLRSLRTGYGRPGRVRSPVVGERRLRKVPPLELRVRDLSVRFGGVIAVDALSFTVSSGEVLGIIGPNGAGKTTVIDAVTGFVPAKSGRITLGDAEIGSLGPSDRARSGLIRSFQSLELFEDLTVEENLQAAADDARFVSYLSSLLTPGHTELREYAAAAVHEFELHDLLAKHPEQLSYAQRRSVAIARAMAAGPSVLLLDEPAAGLDSRSRLKLADLVRRLADAWGIAVVVVEHDIAMILDICDRVLVMKNGRELASGSPEYIRRHDEVIEAYLGRTQAQTDVPGSTVTQP